MWTFMKNNNLYSNDRYTLERTANALVLHPVWRYTSPKHHKWVYFTHYIAVFLVKCFLLYSFQLQYRSLNNFLRLHNIRPRQFFVFLFIRAASILFTKTFILPFTRIYNLIILAHIFRATHITYLAFRPYKTRSFSSAWRAITITILVVLIIIIIIIMIIVMVK